MKMVMSDTLLMTLFLALVIVTCATADLEVSGTSQDSVDMKNVETPKQNNIGNEKVVQPENDGKSVYAKNLETSRQNNIGNDEVVRPEIKGKDQIVGGLKERVEKNIVDSDKNDPSKQFIVAGYEKKNSNSGSHKVDKKENSREGSDSDSESKKETLPSVRKEALRGEECDSSSNSCTIEVNALIACLRVPGNESPDLSLLIQNKGKATITVNISAPAFVKLETQQLELQQKENKKVKVSIGKGGKDNTINLKAGNGQCTLDFKDLIAQGSLKQSSLSSQFPFINFFKVTPSILFIILGALLVIASLWILITFRHKRFTRNSSRYEKLDMELPVSAGSKRELVSSDGWDNSWDERWDDEEAPQTPSIPVTPSLSTKGTAARRNNKEGWKD